MAILNWIRHLLWLSIGLGVTILLGQWSPFLGAFAFVLCLLLYLYAFRRGFFKIQSKYAQSTQKGPSEREATIFVTQLLKDLTRVQVTYLCQDFKTQAAGRAWLKKTLPRVFRNNIDEMQGKLDDAREGKILPELKLAMKIYQKRQTLLQMQSDLERLHKAHPRCTMASPVIFVITDDLSQKEQGNLDVITLASWNPSLPTLIPTVDTVAFFSEVDAGQKFRGHADFDAVRQLAGDHMEAVDPDAGIYLVEQLGDPVKMGVKLAKIPLGFVVGMAELL